MGRVWARPCTGNRCQTTAAFRVGEARRHPGHLGSVAREVPFWG